MIPRRLLSPEETGRDRCCGVYSAIIIRRSPKPHSNLLIKAPILSLSDLWWVPGFPQKRPSGAVDGGILRPGHSSGAGLPPPSALARTRTEAESESESGLPATNPVQDSAWRACSLKSTSRTRGGRSLMGQVLEVFQDEHYSAKEAQYCNRSGISATGLFTMTSLASLQQPAVFYRNQLKPVWRRCPGCDAV